MCSIPLALVFGILGIVLDKRKVLAIIATIITGGFGLFYVFRIIIGIVSASR